MSTRYVFRMLFLCNFKFIIVFLMAFILLTANTLSKGSEASKWWPCKVNRALNPNITTTSAQVLGWSRESSQPPPHPTVLWLGNIHYKQTGEGKVLCMFRRKKIALLNILEYRRCELTIIKICTCIQDLTFKISCRIWICSWSLFKRWLINTVTLKYWKQQQRL